jgi:hypothetical protein
VEARRYKRFLGDYYSQDNFTPLAKLGRVNVVSNCVKDFDFVFNDEFGYTLHMTNDKEMYMLYKPQLVPEIERPPTTKELLIWVFQ